mmetsp:Transcript_19981/g.56606  ORF Transcript_19981/g.56606 Transcript_19981/m.56606 type:complete len:304 (-) Transcript_19981:2027-2938(-)
MAGSCICERCIADGGGSGNDAWPVVVDDNEDCRWCMDVARGMPPPMDADDETKTAAEFDDDDVVDAWMDFGGVDGTKPDVESTAEDAPDDVVRHEASSSNRLLCAATVCVSGDLEPSSGNRIVEAFSCDGLPPKFAMPNASRMDSRVIRLGASSWNLPSVHSACTISAFATALVPSARNNGSTKSRCLDCTESATAVACSSGLFESGSTCPETTCDIRTDATMPLPVERCRPRRVGCAAILISNPNVRPVALPRPLRPPNLAPRAKACRAALNNVMSADTFGKSSQTICRPGFSSISSSLSSL